MKKLTSAIFAFALILSATFISSSISSLTNSGDSFSVQAQTSVKRKRKVGATRRIYRGGKHVATNIWTGSKWVAHKSLQGGRWVTHKTWRGGKKVVSRTKKIVY